MAVGAVDVVDDVLFLGTMICVFCGSIFDVLVATFAFSVVIVVDADGTALGTFVVCVGL